MGTQAGDAWILGSDTRKGSWIGTDHGEDDESKDDGLELDASVDARPVWGAATRCEPFVRRMKLRLTACARGASFVGAWFRPCGRSGRWRPRRALQRKRVNAATGKRKASAQRRVPYRDREAGHLRSYGVMAARDVGAAYERVARAPDR